MTNQSPDPSGTTIDQSGQTVRGDQTNIAGNLYTYNYALATRASILDAPSPDLSWLTAGRGEELDQLNQWYDAVLADKAGEQPRTVVVTGAAGIGKREIVQRWALALPNHERPPTVVQSSYPPAYFDDGQQESFYATQPRWQAAWGSHVPQLRLRYPQAELLGGRGWLALAAQVVDLSNTARHVFDRATPPHAVGQHGEALADFQALLDEVLCIDHDDEESRPGALLIELEEPVILPTADLERRERGMALYRFDPPLLAQLLQAQQPMAERAQRGTRYLQALIAAYHPLEREIAPLLIQLATQLGRVADAARFQQWIAPQADLDRAQLLLATLRAIAIDGPSQQHFVRRVTEFFDTFYGKVHPRAFLPLLADAATYAADLNQIGSQAYLLNSMGHVYSDLGEKQQALALYHEALPLRRKVGDIGGEASTLTNMGHVYADLGEQQQALALYHEALPLFRKVGDIGGEASTLTNMGAVYSDLGEQQQARALFQQALPLFERASSPDAEIVCQWLAHIDKPEEPPTG